MEGYVFLGNLQGLVYCGLMRLRRHELLMIDGFELLKMVLALLRRYFAVLHCWLPAWLLRLLPGLAGGGLALLTPL